MPRPRIARTKSGCKGTKIFRTDKIIGSFFSNNLDSPTQVGSSLVVSHNLTGSIRQSIGRVWRFP